MFSKALRLMSKYGLQSFKDQAAGPLTTRNILYDDDLLRLRGVELLQQLKEKLIGKNNMVPTPIGRKPYIHFDNGASTRTFEPVWESFTNTLIQSSTLQLEIIREAKEIVADFLNAPRHDYDIFFTSNTTESITHLAESLIQPPEMNIEPVILISMLEHSSNDLPWRMAPGHTVVRLNVNKQGFWDLKDLEKILSSYNQEKIHGNKRITMVSVCGASNVLGTCNNLKETGQIAHRYGASFMVDAAQLVAHRKIDMQDAGKVTSRLASNAGIGTRFGCLCAHLLVKYLLDFTPLQEQIQRLAVLLVPSLKLQGFTRVSFGIENSTDEVDVLLNELQNIANTKHTQHHR